MKKTKLFVSGIIIAAFLIGILYAGNRWYSHESEVNAKLWKIQASTESIADSLTEKEEPYIDLLEKTVLREMLSGSKEKASNAYLKMAAGLDVNLLVVGDSTSAQDWTEKLSDQIFYHFGSKCKITNVSMGGNTCYAGYVRTKILEDSQFDLALICFGQNDPVEDFQIFYEATIRAVLEKNPNIEMISMLESSQRAYTEKINCIAEIAKYYDIAIADTIAAYNNSGYSYEALSPDGVHPGELGEELYLRTVMNVIFEKVKDSVFQRIDGLDNKSQNKEEDISTESDYVKSALHPETAIFEEFVFVPAEKFTRVNDLSYSVSVPDYKGLMGIYCARIPGKNDVQLFCESELICSYSEEFNHSFTQEMIYLIDKEQHELSGNIEIVFATTEQAESFRGLIVNIV